MVESVEVAGFSARISSSSKASSASAAMVFPGLKTELRTYPLYVRMITGTLLKFPMFQTVQTYFLTLYDLCEH